MATSSTRSLSGSRPLISMSIQMRRLGSCAIMVTISSRVFALYSVTVQASPKRDRLRFHLPRRARARDRAAPVARHARTSPTCRRTAMRVPAAVRGRGQPRGAPERRRLHAARRPGSRCSRSSSTPRSCCGSPSAAACSSMYEAAAGVVRRRDRARPRADRARSSIVTTLIELPLGLYRTFGIEERFGFNKMTLGALLDRLREERGARRARSACRWLRACCGSCRPRASTGGSTRGPCGSSSTSSCSRSTRRGSRRSSTASRRCRTRSCASASRSCSRAAASR